MPQRNVATNFTFEQQRVEINELAADFWTQKGVTDTAAGTYLQKDGSNAFTGATLAVPNAFTINANSGGGTVTISGNLQVDGTTTTVNTATMDVVDKNITIAKGSANDTAADGAGITVDSATDKTFNFVNADSAFVSSIGLKAVGNITGAVGTLTGLTVDAGANGTIDFGDTNSGTVAFGRLYADNTGTFIGSKSNHDLILRTNNVETTRIDVDGKLVHKCNKASGYIAEFHQEHADNPGTILIDGPSDGNIRPTAIELAQAGSVKWGIGQVYQSTASQAFHICSGAATQANSKLVIRTDGNIGIGDANPSSLLSLKGTSPTLRFTNGTTLVGSIEGGSDNVYYGFNGADIIFSTDSATTYAPRITITATGNTKFWGTRNGSLQASDSDNLQIYTKSANADGDRGSGITFYNHDNSGYEMGGTIQVAKENDTADNTSSYMRFGTRFNGGDVVERLRIDSNGYVGIKVANPHVYYAKDLVLGCIDQGGITLKATATDDTQYLMFADGTSGNQAYRGYIGYQHASTGIGEHLQIAAGGTASVTLDTNGKLAVSGDVHDSKGSLRTLPRNEPGSNAAYTAQTSDKGKFLSVNSNVTFDNTATWNTGDVITVYNYGSSTLTIVSGTGVLIHYTDGTTASTGDRTLASRGLCTLLCVEGSNNTFVISGALT